MSAPSSLDDVQQVEVQALAHVLDFDLNERRVVNLQNPEHRALVDAGLLTIVDPETAALLPPAATSKKGGCGCGK